MKKILNAILMVLVVLSTLLFTTSYFVDTASQSASSTLVYMEIENRVHAIVDEIQAIIPVQNDEAVDTLIAKIQEDEHVSELIDVYAKQFIHDLASDEGHEIDMNDEVHTLLLGFSSEFGAVMGDVINPIYKEAIIREIIVRIDFNDYYAKALDKFKATMSPSQLGLIKVTNTMSENYELYRNISIVTAILALVALIVVNLKEGFGLKQIGTSFMWSGVIHFAIKFSLPLIINSKMPRFSGIFDFGVYQVAAIGLVVVGLVLRVVGSKRTR